MIVNNNSYVVIRDSYFYFVNDRIYYCILNIDLYKSCEIDLNRCLID